MFQVTLFFAPVASIFLLIGFGLLLRNLASILIHRFNPIGSVTSDSKTQWVRTKLLQVFWGFGNLPFHGVLRQGHSLGSFSISSVCFPSL